MALVISHLPLPVRQTSRNYPGTPLSNLRVCIKAVSGTLPPHPMVYQVFSKMLRIGSIFHISFLCFTSLLLMGAAVLHRGKGTLIGRSFTAQVLSHFHLSLNKN